MDGGRLTLILISMIIPFYFFGDWLFHLLWNQRTPVWNPFVPVWLKALSILAAIAVHEAIHGLVFAIYAQGGIRAVSFGFSKQMGALYCHCNEPLPVKHYRKAGIAPFLVLGIVPLAVSYATGMVWLKTFGLLLCIGGFGDLLIWIRLLHFPSDLKILDHPEKMGFIVPGNEESETDHK